MADSTFQRDSPASNAQSIKRWATSQFQKRVQSPSEMLSLRRVRCAGGTRFAPTEVERRGRGAQKKYVMLCMTRASQQECRCILERRTSNPPLQMRGALSGGNGGCSCQVGIQKPHLTSCKAACVHEEVATADSECPLYKTK